MKAVVLPALKERLPLLRREKKMTQKQMAALMDCTEQHYQKIEYGRVNVPATTIIYLAQYFGVTADYLLGLDTMPETNGSRGE